MTPSISQEDAQATNGVEGEEYRLFMREMRLITQVYSPEAILQSTGAKIMLAPYYTEFHGLSCRDM